MCACFNPCEIARMMHKMDSDWMFTEFSDFNKEICKVFVYILNTWPSFTVAICSVHAMLPYIVCILQFNDVARRNCIIYLFWLKQFWLLHHFHGCRMFTKHTTKCVNATTSNRIFQRIFKLAKTPCRSQTIAKNHEKKQADVKREYTVLSLSFTSNSVYELIKRYICARKHMHSQQH